MTLVKIRLHFLIAITMAITSANISMSIISLTCSEITKAIDFLKFLEILVF